MPSDNPPRPRSDAARVDGGPSRFAQEAPGLTVLHIITGLDQGGAENVLERLVRSDHSHRHVIISLHWEGAIGRRLREAGYAIHFLGFERGSFHIRGIVTLWRLIRDIRPDVLQTWMYHPNLLGGVLGWLAGVPAIVWNIRRTSLEPHRTSLSTRAIAKAAAWLSGIIPSRIICCAEAAAESHRAFGYRVDRIQVIHNGTNVSRFRPDYERRAKERRRLGIADDERLAGYVARLHPDKDHPTLFEALRTLADRGVRVRCLLAGTGTDWGSRELAALAERAGVAEQLIGVGEGEDVAALMNAIDVHVSSSATEGFPNVIAEAMASGVPCVATDVGETRTIIGDSGWIVPSGSPEELATAIEEALDAVHGKEWDALKSEVRLRIEQNFGIDAMVRAYGDMWSRVAKRPALAPSQRDSLEPRRR